MLADVEDTGGTGTKAHVDGLKICGRRHGANHGRNTTNSGRYRMVRFVCAYENPKYAVVIMVEPGSTRVPRRNLRANCRAYISSFAREPALEARKTYHCQTQLMHYAKASQRKPVTHESVANRSSVRAYGAGALFV